MDERGKTWHTIKTWGKGFHKRRLFTVFSPQTFTMAVANVYDGGCKRLRWRLQTFAGKDANVCGEKRQNRAKIWPKTAPQTFGLQYAKGKAPKRHHLSIDFQWIGMAFHKVPRPDAYICNLTCKRLRPRLQTFASRKSTAHRHQELPPTDHT